MTSEVLVLIFLTLFVNSAVSLRCQTCKGNDCDTIVVPFLDCNRKINKLPYYFESSAFNLVDADFNCINLEYLEADETTSLRQCYLVSPTEDLCEEIKSQLPLGVQLQKCSIRSLINFDPETFEDGSSSSTTEESSTVSTSPEPSHSPTSSSETESPSSSTYAETEPTSSSTSPPETEPPSSPSLPETEPPSSSIAPETESTLPPRPPSSPVTEPPTTTESTTTTDAGGGVGVAIMSLFALTLSLIIQRIL